MSIARPSPRLHGLTILRFVAAFWVVVFHLEARTGARLPARIADIVHNGTLAMSLFFVLSGIVLSYGYRQFVDGAAIRQFYFARFARIYPAYLTVHLLALIWFTPASNGLGPWLYANALSALGLQAWFPNAFLLGINGGTWTLSDEFFFYALFPVLLPALHWVREKIGTPLLCVGLVLVIGWFGVAPVVFGGGHVIYYISPALRLPEFVLGVVLGLRLWSAPPPTRWSLLNWVAAAVVVLPVVSLPLAVNYGLANVGNGIVVPAIAWLLYATVRAEQYLRPAWRGLPARLFIYLGESSYCLFLAQLIPISYLDTPAGRAWREKLARAGTGEDLLLLSVLASFVLAVLLHELVEKPVRRALLRRGRVRPAVEPAV